MKKYIYCALPMLAGVEVLSLICLCALVWCAVYDLFRAMPKDM